MGPKNEERLVEHGASASLLTAGLAALGIVYGDIGTSPLYAFKIAAETVAGGGTIGSDPAPGMGSCRHRIFRWWRAGVQRRLSG